VRRGDVYELPEPRRAVGHEQRGPRYGVVVQSDLLLGLSTWLIAPTSTRAQPATFRPEVDVRGRPTRVLVEQSGVVDPRRLGERVGHLGFTELRAVEDALRLVLEL
jgi:mRNA interferase MazF